MRVNSRRDCQQRSWRRGGFGLAFAILLASQTARSATPPHPIRLSVDATEASRKIFHVHMLIPNPPPDLTLYFAKWIPGEHSPSGQITNLVGLKITTNGQPVAWQRDPVDMFAFHCAVPKGASAIEASFDYLSPTEAFDFQGGVSATATSAIVNWNQMLLYPKGWSSDELTFATELRLPDGWKYGTALPVDHTNGNTIAFVPVSLTTLVDSPVNLGPHYRRIELSPGSTPAHYMDVIADSDAALQWDQDTIDSYKRLLLETNELFGGTHHYRSYHFLVTLSDPIAKIAQEHHESSDDRFRERSFLDADSLKVQADVLPHEFVHSWNGKYRRPTGLTTPNFQEPMIGELLWVYEGLTQYLGEVLAARSGAWSADDYRENLALTAAMLDHRGGRSWRPLEDTAVAAQLLYFAPESWAGLRRGTDFYPEGTLVWLAVDTLIRQQSEGRRSLDDFCRQFHGGSSGRAEVRPYTFDDLTASLNQVAPYDWKGFFHRLVSSITVHAPMEGIETGGWKLAYSDRMPGLQTSREHVSQTVDLSYSLGLLVKNTSEADHGKILDVLVGSPAEKAGVGPGMRLVAVQGRKWSPENLREAVQAATQLQSPIELLVQNGDFYKTVAVDYHQGERYPHLERDPAHADLLSQIIRSRSAAPRRAKP
ncbi:MAG: peptidase M61 [Acidobacteria bacterium]|nr:MAG: peptidase M61 [Acidobacteriota bacterium]